MLEVEARIGDSGCGYPTSHCSWFLCGQYKVKGCSLLGQWIRRYASSPPSEVTIFFFFSGFQINYMLLLTLSWPTRSLFILAFCPPAIVPCCLPGGKSKDRILNPAAFSALLHFPLIIAVLLLRLPLSMFTNFFSLRAAAPPTVLRNSALSMGNYTGPQLGVSFFVLTYTVRS